MFKNMYKEVYYSVKLPEGLTQKISSTVGLKRGCILNPTLFSFYINYLVDMFDSTCDPVEVQNRKLYCLLYADDIVLLSTSANGLQNCTDKLKYFCKKWNLSVNLNRTYVLIFNKAGGVVRNLKCHYCSENIAIAGEYNYSGILLKPSGVFSHAIKAMKAIFCIRKQLVSDRLNVLQNIKLFETCVRQILLYCSELTSTDVVVRENTDIENRYKILLRNGLNRAYCSVSAHLKCQF